MPITPSEALQRCIEHRELFHDEMTDMMRLIMTGEMSPELVAGLLVALRTKKETVGEIAAAAQVMREFATSVHVEDRAHLVDVVGTGATNLPGARAAAVRAAGDAQRGGRPCSRSPVREFSSKS